MDQHGFLRVAAAIPPVTVADPMANSSAIAAMLDDMAAQGVEIAVFPEMSLTAYTCADLFHSRTLTEACDEALVQLLERNTGNPVTFAIGMPVVVGADMYNCAVLGRGNRLLAVIPKTYIPNYNEFYERRWWRSGTGVPACVINIAGNDVTFGVNQLVEIGGVRVGAEICEDLWVPVPPSCGAAMAGAEVILNLSASDALTGKYDYLRELVSQQSARCLCAYVYASAGFGESSTDLVFDGIGLIASNGCLQAAAERWQPGPDFVVSDIDIEALRRDRLHIGSFGDCAARNSAQYSVTAVRDCEPVSHEQLLCPIDRLPFVPDPGADLDRRCEEIVNIQSQGLARRLDFTHCRSLVVGISGGLDSTLALLVAVHAFDRLRLPRTGIIGVTMPGFGTTGRTHDNAVHLMEVLGVTMREISIVPAVTQHFKDIDHDPDVHDVTYENAQARQRTYLLMDIANQAGGIVLGTGDLSELALGWATYNGDHMSMYGVNAGVPKTLVRHLVRWFASTSHDERLRETLFDVADTPISPELIPAKSDGTIEQKTEDLVGPYELHDFFLYYMLRYGFSPARIFYLAQHAFAGIYDDHLIKHWLRTFVRRFFAQQFKRSCLPDGPKVGSVCLSPRGDWRMPSDATASAWLDSLDSL